MAKCNIQTEINNISKSTEASELLYSIGIDIDEESGQNKLKTLLSMALSKDNYQMFLEKQKQLDKNETVAIEPEIKTVDNEVIEKTYGEKLLEEAIESGSDILVEYQTSLNKAYEDKKNTEDEQVISKLNQNINMYKSLIKNEKVIINIRKNNTLTSGKFAGELHSDYRDTINNYNSLSNEEKQFYSLSELKEYAKYDGLILSTNSISNDIKKKITEHNKNNSEKVDIQNFVLANVIKNVIKNKNKSFKERYGITEAIEYDIDSLLNNNDINISEEVKNINELTSNLIELPFAQNIKTIINSRLFNDDTVFSTIESFAWNEKAFEDTNVSSKEKQINDVKAKLNKNGIVETTGKNSKYAYASAIGLLLAKNDSKNVLAPTYLKNLIKTHGLASIGEMYKTTSISEFDDNFDDVWGIKKGEFDVDRKHLESLLRQGYIPQSMVVNVLGSAIYKDLPIKFNKNVESELASKLITELGLYAIHVMEKSGVLLESDTDVDNSITIGSGESETTQTLIRLNIDSGYVTSIAYNDITGEPYDKTERIKETETVDGNTYNKTYKEDLIEVSKLMSHLYEMNNRPRPSMTPLESKFNRTVRNGFQKVSEDTNRILNDYESRAQSFKPMTSELFKIWKGSKSLAYSMVGIGELASVGDGKNANGNKFNIEDAEAQASKYNNERLEFDDLMEFYETVAFNEDGSMKSEEAIENIKFYLAWDFTVSGRYMNDSNINPQNSKITRYVVQSNEMSSIMKLDKYGKFDEDQMYNFKIGISQALDFGTDKSTDSEALNGLSKIVNISDNGKVTFTGSDDGKTFEAGFNYFKSLLTETDDTQDKLMSKLGASIGPIRDNESKSQYIIRAFSNKNLGKIVKEGEGVHALSALYALAQIDIYSMSKDKFGEFTHSFTAEADDITSGMILTLMNVGTNQARMLIEKGGVYTSEAKEFWNSTYKDIENIVKTSNEEIILPKMYKNKDGQNVLTHGFLVEFGKLLDNKRTRDYIFDELNKIDATKYSNDILNSRVHFKDFYTTVSKEAKEKISKIENYIDGLFNKDVQIVKEKGANSNKKYIQEMAVRNISQATTGEVYSTVSNIMSESNKILNKVYSKGFSKDNKGNISIFQNLINDIYGFVNLKSSHSKHANYFLLEAKNKDVELWAKYDYLKKYHKESLSDSVRQNPINNKETILKMFNELISKDIASDKTMSMKRYRNMFIKRFEKFTFSTLVKNISKMNMNDLNVKNSENFDKFVDAVNKVVEDKNKAKKDNEESIDEYDAFNIYKDMVMQRSIIKLAGSDISRNAAKNPVMVFIYGSSINSIKKLISSTIVKESIYNKLIDTKEIRKKIHEIDNNKILDPGNEIEALNLVLNEITNNEFSNIATKFRNNEMSEIKFKTVNKEKGIVENVSNREDIKKLILDQDFSGMIINNTMLNRIKQYSDNTYGDAFGTSFKELFGDAIGYREAMKGLELARYSIFKYKLNKEISELAKEKLSGEKLESGREYSYVLSENDLLTIKKKLERQGFGHSVEDSNGARQSLNTTIKALAGTQVRFRTMDMKAGEYKSAAHQMRSETENTGASAVITIHQEDGRKIGLALEGTGMLNIYDAFYSSTNELNKTSNRMNEEFLNVTGNYNPLIKSLEEIEDMIFKLGDKEINEMLNSIDINEYTILSEGMKKINPDYDLFESYYSDYKNRLEGFKIDISSEDVKDGITNETEASVGHNYLSDAAPQAEGKIFSQKQSMVNSKLVTRFYDEIVNRAHDAYLKKLFEKQNDDIKNSLKGSEFKIIEETKDVPKYKPTSSAVKNLERVVSSIISQAPNNTKLATIVDKLKECAKG